MNCIDMEEIVCVAKILACSATVIGIILGIAQWRKNILIKRAEFINVIFEKFQTNEHIRKATYLFDYNLDWYDASFHNSNNKDGRETYVDIGLKYLSYVCYLRKIGILNRSDFALFRYAISRAIINPSTKNYFYNLYHFSKAQRTDFSFPALLWFAKKEKILHDDFYSSDAYKNPNTIFHRYLNF